MSTDGKTRRTSRFGGMVDRDRRPSTVQAKGEEDDDFGRLYDDDEVSNLDETHLKELEAQYLDFEEEDEEEQRELMKQMGGRDWRSPEVLTSILAEPDEEFDEVEDFDPVFVDQKISTGVLRYPNRVPLASSGDPWWSTESDEVQDFRRMVAAAAERDEEAWKRENPGKQLADVQASLLLPRYFAAKMDPSQEQQLPSRKVRVTVEYEGTKIPKECLWTEEAAEVINKCWVEVGKRTRESRIPDGHKLVLKFRGRADYLWGSTQLINFLHVRKAVMSNVEVRLQLLTVEAKRLDDSMVQYNYDEEVPHICGRCCTADVQCPPHEDITVEANMACLRSELSLWDMDVWAELEIRSLSHIVLTFDTVKELQKREGEDMWVCVVGQLYHGTQQLAEPSATPWRVLRGAIPGPGQEILHHAVWGSLGKLRFAIQLRDMPRETRLCLSVVVCTDHKWATTLDDPARLVDSNVRTKSQKLVARLASRVTTGKGKGEGEAEEEFAPIFYLGWVNFLLFDHKDFMRQGQHSVRLWVANEKANPIGVVSTPKNDGSFSSKRHMTITVALPKFARPVRFPHGLVPAEMRKGMVARQKQKMNELEPQLRKNLVNQLRRVRFLIQQDPLYELGGIDKLLLWQFRNDLITSPTALPKLLQSVDWASPAAVQECLHLLHHPDPTKRWTQPPEGREIIALPLLDARYANGSVRGYAIRILDRMHDSQLAECVLQLVQVLKYEPYHSSALARFLLKRSIANPHQIGHPVFWHLKAEMCNPQVQERHGLLIEEMLKRSQVRVRRNFAKQDALIELLLKIGIDVKNPTLSEIKDKNRFIREELDIKFEQLLRDNTTFTLPLDPRMEVKSLHIEKCKVMDSKKLPLWLVFKNADPLGDPILVIFKAGDDLRQDLLTLQMIALMDSMWKRGGLDLHMSPYGCVACDDGVGMIEVVVNSDTIANITAKAGGASMAFHEDPIINWLRDNDCNKTDEGIRTCMWNFLFSCAGYCVATYILGIGDRHNDNIMIKLDGTLFHIDFGHFLGNFKKKFGFDRETAPFVFTPMYAYVLGGEGSKVYDHFCHIACAAYNIIRKHSHVIISMFSLMLSTGIPELQRLEDMHWLRHVLYAGASDEVAAKAFARNIQDAVENKRTRLNDFIHIQVHKH